MGSIKCNKEAELATMAEKINNIESKVDKIDGKLDKFIEKSDETYATKNELKAVNIQVNKNTNRIWAIAKDVAYASGMIFIILKTTGVI